ncbi:hypothetical protein [Nonomuraea sp. LPB2021202275-12-8]|uniref:hypothetical protein n=1 Tax=Nonomuraea sp. LPB2021202275-12-8 TaxID=3120159 RepID=UPI00300D196A
MSADVLALQRLGATRTALRGPGVHGNSGIESRGDCVTGSSAACCANLFSNFVHDDREEQQYGARISTLAV